MPIDYDISKPSAGTSRSTSPTEVEILTDVSDTIADVGSRLDTLESGTSTVLGSMPTATIQAELDSSSRVTVLGDHTLTTTLTIPDDTALIVTGRLIMGAGVTTGITNSDTTNGNRGIEFVGRVDGNSAAQAGDDLSFGAYFQRVSDLNVHDAVFTDVDGQGLHVTGEGVITRATRLNNIHAHNNGTDGVRVEHSSRSVMVSNVECSDNGRHGFVNDHSEGSFSNVRCDQNNSYGFFIRNIFGGNYTGITATRNGAHGIYVESMIGASGSSWVAHGNSTSVANTYDDIHFSDGDLGYGITNESVISGILCGYATWFSATRTERYGLCVEAGVLDGLELHGVKARTGETGDIFDGRNPVLDSFNRADGSFGSSDSGHAWTANAGNWAISGGRASGTGGSATSTVTVDAGSADVDITCDVEWGANMRMTLRLVDLDDYLTVNLLSTGVGLQKIVAGAATTLATSTEIPHVAGTRYRLRIIALGDLITIIEDGQLVLEHTLSAGDQTTYGASTKHGLGSGGSPGSARWDNFTCKNIGAPAI